MGRVVMVILGLVAAIGWTVARASIKAGIKLMRERDEARAALERFGKLPADDGAFVRVNAETLASVMDWAQDQLAPVPLAIRNKDLVGEINYLAERARTVAR